MSAASRTGSRGELRPTFHVKQSGLQFLRGELESLSARRGMRLEVVAGDHATSEGRRLLSPSHLLDLVPDVADRDVYVCGPPGMTAAIEQSVRRAGVPRRQIHAERFAL